RLHAASTPPGRHDPAPAPPGARAPPPDDLLRRRTAGRLRVIAPRAVAEDWASPLGDWAPYFALAIFLIAFGFIVSERVSKVTVVLVAAAAMAVLGLIPGTAVFYSAHVGIDWNVIFLLFGMMVAVGVIKQTGLFDYLGIQAAKLARGRPYRLMVLLMIIT